VTTPSSDSSAPPADVLWLDLVVSNPHAGGAREPAPKGPPVHDMAVDETREEPLDIEARQARSRLRAWIVGEEPDAPRIGRFVVLERLGAGGMGTVYAAYDAELDRRVALKFLHPDRAGDRHAQHRLLREAQALARLSHPHLVEVYEVGRHESEIYLAMEHVAGLTVGVWIERIKPDWREVLRVWLEAGQALALVHAEGLVHRDIKPTNVIVGDDGRARLVDFGLAREVGGLSSRPGLDEIGSSPNSPSPASSGSRLRESVTQSRAVIGTPAYLAPEQRLGEPVAPAADQYSFCVSLYEGLYGCRPRGPVGPEEALDVPDPGAVPMAIRKVLARGLAQRPQDRFGSINALLEALHRPLERRRAGRWVAGLGVAGLTVAAITGWVRPEPGVLPCATAGTELDVVWTDALQQRLRDGGHSAALQTLDAFVEQWATTRRETCEATHVKGVQSDQALDRRVACLDRQREQLAALVASDAAITHPAALASLPAPTDCLAPGIEAGWLPPRAENSDEVAALRRTLAQTRLAALAHGVTSAESGAREALERARAIGYEPVLAEALIVHGVVARLAYRGAESRAALEEAIELAEAFGATDLKEAAIGHLVRLAIDVESDPDAAERAWRRNAASLRRLGASRDRTAALFGRLGLLQVLQENPRAAELSLRAAVALYEAEGPRAAPALAATLYNLADTLMVLGRVDDASTVLERARSLDPRHTDGSSWSGVNPGEGALERGRALLESGELEQARVALEQALVERDEAFGPSSTRVGAVHAALTAVAIGQGELERARLHARASDRAYRLSARPDDPRRLSPLTAIGTVAFEEGRAAEAVTAFSDALELVERTADPDSLELAQQRSNLAEALLLDGQVTRAERLAAAALETMEARLAPDHADLVYPLRALGEARTRRGRAEEGGRLLLRALALHEELDALPVERARTRAWLARAQRAAGQLDLASQTAAVAANELDALGPAYADDARAMHAIAESAPRTPPATPPSTETSNVNHP